MFFCVLKSVMCLPLCGENPEFLVICELSRLVSEGGCLGGSGAGLFGGCTAEP
jgi:hypothetical protein